MKTTWILGSTMAALFFAVPVVAQPKYDLLLKGGQLIDPKNGISGVRDLAVANGAVALVAKDIDSTQAFKVVDVSGLVVVPGLIDMHMHAYAGTGEKSSYAGDNSLYPDGFTLRIGVTTVADAGCAGWRNFEDFKQRVIDRSKTRVLAFLNIVGNGMRGEAFEHNLADMEVQPTVEMAQRYKGLIVGIKTAHFAGPEWAPVERSVEAGKLTGLPVMVDFGANRPERPIDQLLREKLRPGDIYAHVYSGLRNEQTEDGKVNPALWEGRKRGVIFEVAHGGGSFFWRIVVPAVREGFWPDVISTDLHIGSMNSGMKDLLNVMSKFLVLGMPLEEVIKTSTWNPARFLQHTELGQLTEGATADIAILRLENGNYGFTDSYGARMRGTKKLVCEATLRAGKVVYDLNGITRPDWEQLPKNYRQTGDPRWDGLSPKPAGRGTK
jgi:dihydroorotase